MPPAMRVVCDLEEMQMSKKSVVCIRAVAFIGLALVTFVTGWTASLWAKTVELTVGW